MIQYIDNVAFQGSATSSESVAGIVELATQLEMASSKERRYRGFCLEDMSSYDDVFRLFNDRKDEIYAVYQNSQLIDGAYQKSTVKFLDQFYRIINDPKQASRYFTYPCRQDGTGAVIIKGLN